MKIEDDYFSKYVLTAISPDGKVTNVEKHVDEFNHWQPFKRLNEKMNNEFCEEINENNTSYDLPNIVAKHGYIVFYPNLMISYVKAKKNKWCLGAVLPYSPTTEQLNTMKRFYDQIKKVKEFYFFLKPNIGNDLNYGKTINGLDNLKLYVKELEIRIRKKEN